MCYLLILLKMRGLNRPNLLNISIPRKSNPMHQKPKGNVSFKKTNNRQPTTGDTPYLYPFRFFNGKEK